MSRWEYVHLLYTTISLHAFRSLSYRHSISIVLNNYLLRLQSGHLRSISTARPRYKAMSMDCVLTMQVLSVMNNKLLGLNLFPCGRVGYRWYAQPDSMLVTLHVCRGEVVSRHNPQGKFHSRSSWKMVKGLPVSYSDGRRDGIMGET
jgi:hypothetical protein